MQISRRWLKNWCGITHKESMFMLEKLTLKNKKKIRTFAGIKWR